MNQVMMLAQGQGGGTNPLVHIMFLVGIVLVFYFLLIHPQKKKEKQRRQMIDEVGKGDRVITIGGIHGEIVSLKEDTMIVRVDPESGATLKLNRTAVHRVIREETDKDEQVVK